MDTALASLRGGEVFLNRKKEREESTDELLLLLIVVRTSGGRKSFKLHYGYIIQLHHYTRQRSGEEENRKD